MKCFIIGSGSSVNLIHPHHIQKIKQYFTIGINRAFQLFTPNILLWIDSTFNIEEIKDLNCLKICASTCEGNFLKFKAIDSADLDFNIENGLHYANTSGFAAINIANILGFKEIYLLGYDYCFHNEVHFYDHNKDIIDGISINSQVPNSYQDTDIRQNILKSYNILSEKSRNKGVKIYNLSPISVLDCFEKIKIDDVFCRDKTWHVSTNNKIEGCIR